MLSFLRDKKCSFVYCDFYKFTDEQLTNKTIIELPNRPTLKNDNCTGPCFLYSRKVKETIGDYDCDAELAEDYDYWIRVSKKFSICHLGNPLYFYRIHEKSLFRTKYYEIRIVTLLVKMKNGILDIDQVIKLFINLIAEKKADRFQSIGILRGVLFRLSKVLAMILVSKKINTVLKSYESKKVTLTNAKLELKSILDNC